MVNTYYDLFFIFVNLLLTKKVKCYTIIALEAYYWNIHKIIVMHGESNKKLK